MSGFLFPHIDDTGQPFWDGAAVGELRVQQCSSCGRFRFPPRPMCPRCRSVDASWPSVSGRGRVWSFIVPHPPLLPELAAAGRFNIVLVALEEDDSIRLAGNLVAHANAAVDSIDPDSIVIGAPVRAVFPEVEPGVHLLRWVSA